jgi:hypothetical protein
VKPITDKAEIAVDFPNKAYIGSFGRHSAFEVRADGESLALKLEHLGDEHRIAELHLHYFLLADILSDAAQALASRGPLDDAHREPLREAAERLAKALEAPPAT